MVDSAIQIVSNENGQPPAVVVPIELWREIESERETAYLLKSKTIEVEKNEVETARSAEA